MKKRLSTSLKGEAFERRVTSVLRLLPGTDVQDHVRLGGKDIDVVCQMNDLLGGRNIVAFECKDHARPLTRATVTQILADYSILIHNRLIDKFCLITQKGVVANALACFDGKRFQHITYAQLLGRLIEPSSLINNMINRFSVDDLDKYYVPAQCYSIDVQWISNNFDLYYNPFTDFCFSSGLVENLYYARSKWREYSSDKELRKLPDRYSEELFCDIMRAKTEQSTTLLEPLVASWIDNESIKQPLAVLGSYGTGKSSFAKRLAFIWAQKYELGQTDRLPLLIELREFGSHQNIEGLVTHELMNRHGARYGSYELFQLLNREGKFLLILDGFDEMKEGLTRDALIFNFNEINRLYSTNSKIILCGRPTVFASEAEQTLVLSGRSDANFTHAVEYIQIALAPFSPNEIFNFLKHYTRVKYPKLNERMLEMVQKARKEMPRNQELRDLLSRPVHLPMLVAVLPEWEGHIGELRRATLYRMFIDKIIAREMLKRKQEFQSVYDVDLRHRFAAELATHMFRLGDSRSIRYSDITDDLIRPFKRPGQSLDSAKRDLIAACFLERKSPDILFFGHKSFAEYLAAERLVARMSTYPYSADRLGIRITPEILSFTVEIASPAQWEGVLQNPKDNLYLLSETFASMTKTLRSASASGFESVEEAIFADHTSHAWALESTALPEKILYRFMLLLESVSSDKIGPSYEMLLFSLISKGTDLVAVHAFRALNKARNISLADLEKRLGKKRLGEWKEAGWLNEPSSPK